MRIWRSPYINLIFSPARVKENLNADQGEMGKRGEAKTVTAAGWFCFVALITLDVVIVLGFLWHAEAIKLFSDDGEVVETTGVPYGGGSMSIAQWIYFSVLCVCNFVVTLVIISLAGAFGKRLLNKRKLAAAMAPEGERRSSYTTGVTVLLPCYLPNEQVILRGTVAHIMEKIEYPSPFELILCYNTPKPLAIEDELAEMDGKQYENGRTLRVLKVEGSRSKAENLNMALDLVETENVVIYDADHHADPDSLMIASQYMKLHKCACVQGSTYIRYKRHLAGRQIMHATCAYVRMCVCHMTCGMRHVACDICGCVCVCPRRYKPTFLIW